MARSWLNRVAAVTLVMTTVACQPSPQTPSPAPGAAPMPTTRHVSAFLGGAGQSTGPVLAGAAQFSNPAGLAADAAGTLYVVDQGGVSIRKIAADGMVSTLAGGTPWRGRVDGTGREAAFNGAGCLAVGPSGDLFVADAGNNAIRKLTPAGVVTTLAGDGVAGFTNGSASAARFNWPYGVAVDPQGNLFVADTGNHAIRKITPSGVVTTLAGGTRGTADGVGAAAQFSSPHGVIVGASGDLFVADSGNHAIRQVSPSGQVTTLAGNGAQGWDDRVGTAARFNNPLDVVQDAAGDLYVTDTGNNVIRRVTLDGVVTTLAGSGMSWGRADGVGSAAQFGAPVGIALDKDGRLLVTEGAASRIRMVTPQGEVTAFAGGTMGSADGPRFPPRLGQPSALTVDGEGNLFVVVDTHSIRKVSPAREVTKLAGRSQGFAEGRGEAALFYMPTDLLLGAAGELLVADPANRRIRTVTPSGDVSTLAGGDFGVVDGPVSSARFMNPVGLARDASGTLYVADSIAHAIRRITPSGEVSTVAGGTMGRADGVGAAAQFKYPAHLAVDDAANVFVAEYGNPLIRKITPAGEVSTFAGSVEGKADGSGTAAQFGSIRDMAIDRSGNLYVLEYRSDDIRGITPGGEVTTLKLIDEAGANVSLSTPTALCVDGQNQLWVAQADGALFVIR